MPLALTEAIPIPPGDAEFGGVSAGMSGKAQNEAGVAPPARLCNAAGHPSDRSQVGVFGCDGYIQWPEQALLQQLAPDWPGFTVQVLPEVDSTNTELLRRFKADPCAAVAPTLLVAEQQSAGRGRQGRTWHSARGKSLTFSLGLPLQRPDWSGLSLAVGVSVAQSLDPAPAYAQGRIGLKWPNDLCLQHAGQIAKIGGILVETASRQGVRYAVIGIGLNMDLPCPLEWDAAAMPAGSLQTVQPGLQAAEALCKIVPALLQDLQRFAQSGFAPFQDRFTTRDVLAHRAVQCSDGCQGTALGVNEQGALRVQTAAGLQTITQADVSVRPSADLG